MSSWGKWHYLLAGIIDLTCYPTSLFAIVFVILMTIGFLFRQTRHLYKGKELTLSWQYIRFLYMFICPCPQQQVILKKRMSIFPYRHICESEFHPTSEFLIRFSAEHYQARHLAFSEIITRSRVLWWFVIASIVVVV